MSDWGRDENEPRRPSVEPGFLDGEGEEFDDSRPSFLAEDDEKWAAFAPAESGLETPSGAWPVPPTAPVSEEAPLARPDPIAAPPPDPVAAAPPPDPIGAPPPHPTPPPDAGRRRLFGRRRDEPTTPAATPAPVFEPEPVLFGEEPLPAALQLTPDPSLVPGEPAPASPPLAGPDAEPVPDPDPASTTGSTAAVRWRSDAGEYDDDEWRDITAEFQALRAQEAEAEAEGPDFEPLEAPVLLAPDLDIEPTDEAGPQPVVPGGPVVTRNLVTAVVTGLAFGLVALGLIRAGRAWFFVLALVVVMVALVEFYTGMRRARFRPAAAPGLLGSLVILVGTYRQGSEALGFGLSMVLVFTLLWFLLGVIRTHPVANLGVTLLGVLYVTFLGAHAVLILGFPDWQGVMISALALAIASDVGGYAAGSRFGRTYVLPAVSPTKSVEGLLGGAALALVVGLVVVRGLHPFSVGAAIGLALLVAVAAPLGDLCESMLKRAMGVKDLGSVLPGHGGILDRIDSILMVMPVAYYFARWVLY